MADFDEEELIQLSLLRDEETDELISAGLLDPDQRLLAPLESEVTFSYDELTLRVTAGLEYPIQPVSFKIDNVSLPREIVDTLRQHLRQIIILADATNNLENWRHRETKSAFGIFDHVRVVYQLADETAQHVNAYRARRIQSSQSHEDSKPDKHLWFLSPDAKKMVSMSPVTAASTKELAYQLLHKTANDIAAMLPSEFRVLHVEQVLRADHARSLARYQDQLRQRLMKQPSHTLRAFVPRELRNPRIEDMVDHLVKPRITFHGTQRQHVPSIVRHGFVLPGTVNPATGERLDVRCGSTYGKGIYCSPSAAFSLSYTDGFGIRTSPKQFYGLKLFVCATVMGRSRATYRDDELWTKQEAVEGADSHIGNENLEYIVFNQAQIIPVYVIHLDWGDQNAGNFRDIQNPRDWKAKMRMLEDEIDVRAIREKAKRNELIFAGDRQRAKQAVHARAAKYFPYGYGPATGNRFVVEEVGEVSEDEEEYGEYQALRAESEPEKGFNTDFWSWMKVAEEEEDKLREGVHVADEYLDHRHALRVPDGFGKGASKWDELSVRGNDREQTDADEEYGLAMLMIEEDAVQPESSLLNR